MDFSVRRISERDGIIYVNNIQSYLDDASKIHLSVALPHFNKNMIGVCINCDYDKKLKYDFLNRGGEIYLREGDRKKLEGEIIPNQINYFSEETSFHDKYYGQVFLELYKH